MFLILLRSQSFLIVSNDNGYVSLAGRLSLFLAMIGFFVQASLARFLHYSKFSILWIEFMGSMVRTAVSL